MLSIILLILVIFIFYIGLNAFKQQNEYDNEISKRLTEEIEVPQNYVTSDKIILNLRSVLINEKIISIKIFQINDTYFHSHSEGKYIIDGGLELITSKGYFSVAFSNKYEQYIFDSLPFKNIYENDNYFELEEDEIAFIKSVLYKKVKDACLKTKDFDEIVDYTMKTEKITKLVEVFLTFEDNQNLQISLVNNFYEEKGEPKPHKYSVDEEVLISLNRIEIK